MASKFRKASGCLMLGAVVAALPMVLAASPASAADTDIRVTEVAPRANGTPLGDDWFELTNSGSSAINVTGWRVDDESNSFGSGGAVTGITSIAPGESVILVTEATASAPAAYRSQWFGGSPPPGLQVGYLVGSGLGLSSGGDQVNVFNAGGTRVANVSFGSTTGVTPLKTLDNSTGVNGAITLHSEIGVNGAFLSSHGSEIGSPGIANTGGPPPTTTTTPPTTTTTTPPTTTTTPPASTVRVTEVAPRGNDTPLGDDWFELTNTGASPVNITGWRADDNSASFGSAAVLSGVTSLAPGESAIFVTEATASAVTAFANQWFGGTLPVGLQVGWLNGSGLGLSNNGDAVNVFNSGGTIVASVSFSAAPSGSPIPTFDNTAGLDGVTISTGSQLGVNGAFVASNAAELGSPGTATFAGGGGGPTFGPWPGSPNVQPIEDYNFGEDMSGLDYEGSGSSTPGVLWAARNKAGTLFRLVFNGTKWVPDTANNWGAGKDLLYASGIGHPDSEGLTFVGDSSSGGIYIASERDNDNSGVSKNVVLRYDVTGSTPTLTAAQEWDLTADLPPVGANLGLEGITWIDDSYLVGRNFLDESKGHAYNPAEYPNHGTGLFFVAVEGTSAIYAYALESTGAFTRIATFGADLSLVTDVQFDRDEHKLWAECDNTCDGRLSVLEVNPSTGKFEVTSRYERPANLGNNNNEGFAIAPATYCVDGFKPVYWADDTGTNGDSIIAGTLPCNDGPSPVVPEFPAQALPFLTVGGLFAAAWFINRRRSLRPA